MNIDMLADSYEKNTLGTRRIFFLARAYPPVMTGGAQARAAQVKALQKAGLDVRVVTPVGPGDNDTESTQIIRIPLGSLAGQLALRAAEAAGIAEDYLDGWIKKAFTALKDKVAATDIVFATSGGELGMIKLGAILKTATGCKLVINLHDPVDYTTINTLRKCDIPHVSRDRVENKYIPQADLLITTSEQARQAYISKYPTLKTRSITCLLGYINDIQPVDHIQTPETHIIYGGNCGWAQAPQILAEIISGVKDVKATVIGDFRKNPALLLKHKKLSLVPPMPYHDYCRYCMQRGDLSFISLRYQYYSVCIPSKLYESINMRIPILAALPNGDAADIINEKGYGIACKYDDLPGLRSALIKLKDPDFRAECRTNITRDRERWSINNLIKPMVESIKQLSL